jgi:ribosome-binding factor A
MDAPCVLATHSISAPGSAHNRPDMSSRMRRVNEAVKEVLGAALPELKDPRIGFVTITGVETSSDLRHARVFVSVLGSKQKRARSLEGLAAAHGVLQTRLARELRMKRTPQLAFEYDPTVERGVRMTKLIDELAPDDDDRE